MPKAPKPKKVKAEEVFAIPLRGQPTPPELTELPPNLDMTPVTLHGATLQDYRLTPRGFGYELKILVPLEEEEKLPRVRRAAFQAYVDITFQPADALAWEEEDAG